MLQPCRDDFNARFTPQAYASLQESLNARTRTKIEFRVCETPVFFAPELLAEMAETGRILTHQLIDNPELANSPELAARLLASFLKHREPGIRAALSVHDLAQARRLINGGASGLAAFEAAYNIGLSLLSPAPSH